MTTRDLFEGAPPPAEFRFRSLHPRILVGTASDRYAGWIGQIYTASQYAGRINRRTRKLGGKSYTEETLPVDSVREYFAHFPVLELDYTFYAPLLDAEGHPAKNLHVLKTYAQYLDRGDRVILKVPQAVTAQKVRRGNKFAANETYLDPGIFVKRFYEPAANVLGESLAGMIFEQEYQRKQDRVPAKQMASDLDRFFAAIPADGRYHLELRTEAYLSDPVFDVMAKHGVGQVLSHWTWLPGLKKQLAKSGNRFLNQGGRQIIRLMTPRGMRYEDAYAMAHPFDRIVSDMLAPAMLAETVELARQVVNNGAEAVIIVNNRAGGNAPLIARKIADAFLEGK